MTRELTDAERAEIEAAAHAIAADMPPLTPEQLAIVRAALGPQHDKAAS